MHKNMTVKQEKDTEKGTHPKLLYWNKNAQQISGGLKGELEHGLKEKNN